MPPDHAVFLDRLRMELQQTVEAMQHVGRSASTVKLNQSSIGSVSRIDAHQQQALAKGLQERVSSRKHSLEAALA